MKKTAEQLAEEFLYFCKGHPEYAFWEALKEFAELAAIYASEYSICENDDINIDNTLYWKGINNFEDK